MIEAELKAELHEPERVAETLRGLAREDVAVYEDVYYDLPQSTLMLHDRELRIRTIDGSRHLLTYKDAAVDAESRSKPEQETVVGNAAATDAILRGLGYLPSIAFTKECRNFTLRRSGREVNVTVTTIPELGRTFLEVETIVSERHMLTAALRVLRHFLDELGISPRDLTGELYTDMIRQERTGGRHA